MGRFEAIANIGALIKKAIKNAKRGILANKEKLKSTLDANSDNHKKEERLEETEK
ncbi:MULTISPECIES: hypothetical protein [unclassified Croceitalea]|uniref:hypothetical protein n=1 Tax=unclassified Croceitalea TaxID=2632280 RepID=UPI0030DA05C8